MVANSWRKCEQIIEDIPLTSTTETFDVLNFRHKQPIPACRNRQTIATKPSLRLITGFPDFGTWRLF